LLSTKNRDGLQERRPSTCCVVGSVLDVFFNFFLIAIVIFLINTAAKSLTFTAAISFVTVLVGPSTL
jgi:large-conductance mechanosensitive channel